MEVEVIKIYKGHESRKKVIVWGDNGMLCRPYLSQFDTKQYYVIAFEKGNTGRGNTGEKETDYAISICGDYWLKADFKKKMASGHVSEDQQSIRLSEIKAKLGMSLPQ